MVFTLILISFELYLKAVRRDPTRGAPSIFQGRGGRGLRKLATLKLIVVVYLKLFLIFDHLSVIDRFLLACLLTMTERNLQYRWHFFDLYRVSSISIYDDANFSFITTFFFV